MKLRARIALTAAIVIVPTIIASIDRGSRSHLTRGARGDLARTRAPEGQGLGLHIALRAAALHDLA